ncbi:Bgt-50179 [Blumeria graminis f. sp. tritici]|uniref:Bgt-50179 n=1 Tax=Blumeria graminis f. sp. tritici TaxID=62690 RepID=A0A9X9MKD0_BLUGR|nr:Bgt-50179 [Blumeria graminis f. sp. tritici]
MFGNQRSFLLSIWWILTIEGSERVPSTKVSSGISKCTHFMSDLNVKPSYRRI